MTPFSPQFSMRHAPPDGVHTLVILKEMCRMGTVIPKDHIGFMMETSEKMKADTLLQSFLGRSCGYHNNVTLRVYIPKAVFENNELHKYVNFWGANGGSVENYPTCAANLRVDRRMRQILDKKTVPIIPIRIKAGAIELTKGKKLSEDVSKLLLSHLKTAKHSSFVENLNSETLNTELIKMFSVSKFVDTSVHTLNKSTTNNATKAIVECWTKRCPFPVPRCNLDKNLYLFRVDEDIEISVGGQDHPLLWNKDDFFVVVVLPMSDVLFKEFCANPNYLSTSKKEIFHAGAGDHVFEKEQLEQRRLELVVKQARRDVKRKRRCDADVEGHVDEEGDVDKENDDNGLNDLVDTDDEEEIFSPLSKKSSSVANKRRRIIEDDDDGVSALTDVDTSGDSKSARCSSASKKDKTNLLSLESMTPEMAQRVKQKMLNLSDLAQVQLELPSVVVDDMAIHSLRFRDNVASMHFMLQMALLGKWNVPETMCVTEEVYESLLAPRGGVYKKIQEEFGKYIRITFPRTTMGRHGVCHPGCPREIMVKL